MRVFSIIELAIKQVERLLDLSNLLHKTMIGRIPTKFDVRTMSSRLQTSLRNLQRRLLVADGLLQLLDVLLLEILSKYFC